MVNNLTISVITGSLGSGKSTVAQLFEKFGAKIIDSDILAREVVTPGSEGLKRIIDHFGPQYISPSGQLDRKALGQLVFNDRLKLRELEDILHPLIRQRYKQRIEEIQTSAARPSLILSVIPLFFESRFTYPEVKNVIVVSTPKEECIKRVMERDNCSRELAEKKYDSQLPIKEKERSADFVIYNDGDISNLERQVMALYSILSPKSVKKPAS